MPEESVESNRFRVLFLDPVDPSNVVRMESYATLPEAALVGSSARAPLPRFAGCKHGERAASLGGAALRFCEALANRYRRVATPLDPRYGHGSDGPFCFDSVWRRPLSGAASNLFSQGFGTNGKPTKKQK